MHVPRISLRVSATKLTISALIFLLAGTCMAQHYRRTDLTADMSSTSSTAANLDPNLVNAWGLARGSSTFFWVADNGTGNSSLLNGAGVPQSLVVKIPTADGSGTSAPTGAVFNFGRRFEVSSGNPAVFIFCTEDGTIAAWNPMVDQTNAVVKVKRGGQAIYKGCAIAETADGFFLYATNFMKGTVDVFDSNFTFVREANFNPGGNGGSNGNNQGNQGNNNLVPFGIQNVGGNLVVTFAVRPPGAEDEQHGPGLGAVAIFNPNGRRLLRLERGNFLDAPWGVALAPMDFGRFSHRLLIGNFGDGTINAFNIVTGAFEGKLLASGNNNLTIDGLWALSFGGNAMNNGSATEMFFTAGPNDESNGLFGKITPVASEGEGTSE